MQFKKHRIAPHFEMGAVTGVPRRTSNFIFSIAVMMFLLSFLEGVVVTNIPLLRTPPAFVAAALVATFLLSKQIRSEVFRGPVRYLLLFALLCFASYCLQLVVNASASFETQIFSYLSLVQPIVLLFVLLHLIKSRRDSALFFSAFCIMSLTMVFSAKFLEGWNEDLVGARFGFSDVNLNRQAYVYAIASLIFIWALFELRERKTRVIRYLSGFFLFITLTALALTASRTGFLAFLGGIVAFLLITPQRLGPQRLIVSGVVFLIILWLSLADADLLFQRFRSITETGHTGLRDVLIKASWELSLEKPFLGFGSSATAELGSYLGRLGPIDAHNAHFQIILRAGYPVYFIWLAFMISVFKLAWGLRAQAEARLALILLFATFAFSGTGSLVSSLFYWLVMTCVLGLLRVIQIERRAVVHRFN
jgi:O-antigen ligase